MRGKNLTRRMKEFLEKRKHDPNEWLVTKNTTEFVEFVHRENPERIISFDKTCYEHVYF